MGTRFLLQSLLRLQQDTRNVHRERKVVTSDGFLGAKWQVLSRTSHSACLSEPPVHHSNQCTCLTISHAWLPHHFVRREEKLMKNRRTN
ncbi:hypothetical protein ZIOFF_003827 [Zingiber officinale]|uniref:Uncharacterized protein n=1 Tax=Zingiber officinale TaxID=94328 RepID=A0A8J5IQ13_ZINOF|nr:hypothetical protein ZIOFF_003827 [Zingiber officinale]